MHNLSPATVWTSRGRDVACLCLASAFLFGISESPAWGKRGKCLAWGNESIEVQKCARYSSTGHCAHWTTTTKSQKVCTEREGEGPSATTAPPGTSAPVLIADWHLVSTHEDWMFNSDTRYKASRWLKKWRTDYRDVFGIESSRSSTQQRLQLEADPPGEWKAAGYSSICEFDLFGSRPPVNCQNQIPVDCDGQQKLCPVETHAVLVDYRLPENKVADYFFLTERGPPYKPTAFLLFEGPQWSVEDVTCSCELRETPMFRTAALPVRGVPNELDCRTATECHQKGNQPGLDRESRIPYHEAACFAGSAQGCLEVGAMLLAAGDRAPARSSLVKSALARSCFHGQASGCGLLGQFFDGGDGREVTNYGLSGRSVEIETATYWYQKACDGGIQSACERGNTLSSILTRYDQRKKECEGYPRSKKPKRRKSCDLEAVEWLKTASRPVASSVLR